MAPGALVSNIITSQSFGGPPKHVKHPLNVQECKFPVLDEDIHSTAGRQSISLELASLEQFCAFSDAVRTPWSCLLQVTWAIALKCYTGNDSVCFGVFGSVNEPPGYDFSSDKGKNPIVFIANDALLASEPFLAVLERWKYKPLAPWDHEEGARSNTQDGAPEPPFDTLFLGPTNGKLDTRFTVDDQALLFPRVGTALFQVVGGQSISLDGSNSCLEAAMWNILNYLLSARYRNPVGW